MHINPFSQSKITFKISFKIHYKDIEIFEELFINPYLKNVLSVSTYEVESMTIEAMPQDIWCLEVYLSEKPDFMFLNNQINKFAQDQKLEILDDLKIEQIEDQDWVSIYQNGLKPIEIGRFFISSRIHKDLCPKDKEGVFIDASRAFGTGEHATTFACIETLEQLSYLKFDNILDIGTGTGILSFIAKKLWPNAKVMGCDIESTAIEIAHNNAEFNNLEIFFYENSLDSLILSEHDCEKFDLIISNILAKPLIELSSQIRKITTDDARVILSGFLDYQVDDVLSAFEKNEFELESSLCKDSWITLIIKVKRN